MHEQKKRGVSHCPDHCGSRVQSVGAEREGLTFPQLKKPEALSKLSKEIKAKISNELFTVPSSFVGHRVN